MIKLKSVAFHLFCQLLSLNSSDLDAGKRTHKYKRTYYSYLLEERENPRTQIHIKSLLRFLCAEGPLIPGAYLKSSKGG